MVKAVVRTTATWPPELYAQIEAAAKRQGISVIAWLHEAAREKLEKERQ